MEAVPRPPRSDAIARPPACSVLYEPSRSTSSVSNATTSSTLDSSESRSAVAVRTLPSLTEKQLCVYATGLRNGTAVTGSSAVAVPVHAMSALNAWYDAHIESSLAARICGGASMR